MGSRARRYPDHVFCALCGRGRLRCRYRFEVKIQLRRPVRLGFRIVDRSLDSPIHYQRYAVNSCWQTIGNVAALCIRLDGFEQLAAIFRFDPNICAFYRMSLWILDGPLKSRSRGLCGCNTKNQPNETHLQRFDKHSRLYMRISRHTTFGRMRRNTFYRRRAIPFWSVMLIASPRF